MNYIKEYKKFKGDNFYHGSDKKLNSLKPMLNNSGESKFLGDGIYISNSKDISGHMGNIYI